MRGLESYLIYGIIILLAVIVIIMIIVFGPAIGFSNTTKSRTTFEEFCVFWSADNYVEGWGDEVKALPNTPDYLPGQRTPSYFCPIVLGANSQASDIDRCRSCCKKETIC